MIFVTVGGQTPFDRLIRCVDQWAGERGRNDVMAQIGTGSHEPVSMEWTRQLAPAEFRETLQRADCVVAHAGMGTVLSALQLGVPLLVMPRHASLRETRNDHQIATARRLRERGLVTVANDETELRERLDALQDLESAAPIGPHADASLIRCLRRFIAGEELGS